MALTLTIGGTTKAIKRDSLRLTQTANGQDQLSVTVDSADGSYRPALDAEVILTQDSDTVFGGFVNEPEEVGLGNKVGAHSTIVSALDYNSIASRRYFEGTLTGGTLKSILTFLLNYLEDVTLDAGQADGPTLPDLPYGLVTIEDLLNDLVLQTDGWIWNIDADKVLSMIEPGTVSAPFNIAAGDGHCIGDVSVKETRTSQYANRVFLSGGGVVSVAEDSGEQATHGIWELPVVVAQPVEQSVGDALTAAALARALIVPKLVKYRTHTAGLRVGMAQTINLPARNVNNTFLITDLSAYQVGKNILEWDVTAQEGVVYQTGWRETYKGWGGGTASVTALGGGSSTRYVRYALQLADGTVAVSSATPTWVAASSMQVQLNTAERGTLSASVIVRLRAISAGVSVQARLFDVTDSVACSGTSSTETSTSFVTVTFTATLTAGSHFYELQLLPGSANEPVMAAGYVV